MAKGIPCYSCHYASILLHDDRRATFKCDLYGKEVEDIEVLWDNPNGLNICDGYLKFIDPYEDDKFRIKDPEY